MSAIVCFRFFFSTPCSWMLWRVVNRRVPLAYSPQMSSIARYWSAVITPPGIRRRIIIMYALPTPGLSRFFRASRSSCWYVP